MTQAYTLFSDISTYVNNILEGSIQTLVQQNVLVPTVHTFSDVVGMNPRKVYRWGTLTMRTLAEGADMTPDNISKALAQTFTPARFGDQVLLTDERLATDWEGAQDEAVMLLGDGAARHIDQNIGSAIPNLTGGTITVSTGLGTATWSHILAARAMAQQRNIPGPYFCALGAGQWFQLVNNGGTANNSTFMRSPAFQDRVTDNYFVSALFGDVTFVVSNGLVNAGGGTCYGGLYNREAIGFDSRMGGFRIEPQRIPSRAAWALNANFWYTSGYLDPLKGIQIISTDVIPTT